MKIAAQNVSACLFAFCRPMGMHLSGAQRKKKSPAFISINRQARQPLSEPFAAFVYPSLMTPLPSGEFKFRGDLLTLKLEINMFVLCRLHEDEQEDKEKGCLDFKP